MLYPEYNTQLFSDYFIEHYTGNNYVSLKISDILNNKITFKELLEPISNIEKDKKYFTITEFFNFNLPNNIINFGAGYGDIPIPYLATYPELNIKNIKEREKIIGFRGHLNEDRIKLKKYSIENRLNTTEYFNELNNTILSLCPQGCDNSSYRLYESIYTGAIPVYISDNHFLPFKEIIDYSKFMILLKWDELDKLEDIKNMSLTELQSMQDEVIKHKKYFTYQYTYDYIINYINEQF